MRPHIYCNLLSKPVRKGRHNTFHIDGKMKQQLMMTEETDNYGLTYRRTHGDDGGKQWAKKVRYPKEIDSFGFSIKSLKYLEKD